MTQQPIEIVKRFIVDHFLFGESEELPEDASFIESGIIDSTGILELVSFLEETFDLIIEDEELVPENLDSLSRMACFLRRKLNGRY